VALARPGPSRGRSLRRWAGGSAGGQAQGVGGKSINNASVPPQLQEREAKMQAAREPAHILWLDGETRRNRGRIKQLPPARGGLCCCLWTDDTLAPGTGTKGAAVRQEQGKHMIESGTTCEGKLSVLCVLLPRSCEVFRWVQIYQKSLTYSRV